MNISKIPKHIKKRLDAWLKTTAKILNLDKKQLAWISCHDGKFRLYHFLDRDKTVAETILTIEINMFEVKRYDEPWKYE